MRLLNGFDAAKIIMERFEDRPPLIVFTTSSSKYSIRGYEVAFRYLLKPVSFEDFYAVMSAAIKKLAPKKLDIVSNGKTLIIPVNEILYCEVYGHNSIIHTSENSYETRSSLKNIEDSLQGGGFVRPHSSYLVNLEQVASADQNEIILKNGFSIKISRHKKNEFLKTLYEYLRR